MRLERCTLRCSILVARQELMDTCMALDSEVLRSALHSTQHPPKAVFRSSRKSDRNNCWSVYRVVQVGNRFDMLKAPSEFLVSLEDQECEMLLLASIEEQVEDGMGC